MSRTVITVWLIAGSILAAWLRFDVGSIILSCSVAFLFFLAAWAGWIFQARRLPPVQPPRDVQELGARDELTPDEETRFAAALRAWHRYQQQNVWREIERVGPGPQIRFRAVFYFLWLSLFAIVLLPAVAVPDPPLPQAPRFIMVLLPLAAAAVAIAAPLGMRDWRRARRALADPDSLPTAGARRPHS